MTLSENNEFNDEISLKHQQIKDYIAKGNELFTKGEYAESLKCYNTNYPK